ncbi:MAG TPA: T9SS type A sorting domain-containing protein [Candidatus Kapabacteria bacterium]|nr:T9SS type A sorting domain-containing protein [Candidatus Kapabacteria bacterium]
MLISIDSGKAFQYSDTPDSLFRKSSIATLAVMDTNIFVCLGSEFNSKSHIFISSNYGKTWVENTSGLDGIYIRTLKVNNNFLIAGTSNGVYFSSNMGESWSRKNSGIPDNTLITSIEVSGEHIVATSEKMVYVSADMGENWQASNNGFPQNSNILQSIVINDKIFICNANYGVYISSDFGLNWVSKNDGLENLFATNFAKLGDFLFVSTLGTGSTRNNDAIYKAKIIDLLSDIDEKQEINTNIFYPNPATDFININIDISDIGLAQIYNIYGSEIMQYNLKTTNSGIDISALVPGVYYLRIGSKVAKLIKI